MGGKFPHPGRVADAALLMSYTGRTYFPESRWNRCEREEWVLDYLNAGGQQQAIGTGPVFQRRSGVAALYEPRTQYREYQPRGTSLDESYIVFRLDGERHEAFERLTGAQGWVHVRDPDASIEGRLRRLGEVLFYRGPGYALESRGLFLELLGILEGSVSVGPRLRQVRRGGTSPAGEDMAAVVERYVREHIDEPIQVKQLADQVGMGTSAFAHRYPESCGETPYQTVLRLKVETAKRLLLWEEISVQQAADRTGFSSPFHLSRVFKRLEGLAPTHWLRAMREKGPSHPPPSQG
jgi:AraC-like DNA-binding protein